MRPTKRGLILLCAPAVIVVAAAPGAPPIYAFAAFALAAGLVILDATAGCTPSVRIERTVGPRLSVGASSKVTLTVVNVASRPVQVCVRDGAPTGMNPDRHRIDVALPGGGSSRVEYRARPDRRGTYLFDDAWVELPGRLGLAHRQHRIGCVTLVAVVPDIRALRAWDLLARRAMTREAGLRALRRIGEGSEVERLREYLPGDDYRRIDWKATARRQHPITREMEAERRRHVVFMVDCGRWMTQPVDRLLKVDHALNASLLASHVADRSGDLTGVLTFSDRVLSWIPPAAGRTHQAMLLEELHTTPVEPVEPSFPLAFRHLARRQRRRALIVLFSDFGDQATAADLLETLPVLARRHLVLCVQLLDPEIESLAAASPSDLLQVNRRAIAIKLRDERRLTLDRLRAQGAHVLEALAGSVTSAVVNRYLELKGRGEL